MKPAVSRCYVALSQAKLADWLARDLSDLDLLAIQIGCHPNLRVGTSKALCQAFNAESEAIHRELKRPGVTQRLLWEEYRANEPDGYSLSRFCELYGAWRGRVSAVMRQRHIAGEKLFVVKKKGIWGRADRRDLRSDHRRGPPGPDLRRRARRVELHLR